MIISYININSWYLWSSLAFSRLLQLQDTGWMSCALWHISLTCTHSQALMLLLSTIRRSTLDHHLHGKIPFCPGDYAVHWTEKANTSMCLLNLLTHWPCHQLTIRLRGWNPILDQGDTAVSTSKFNATYSWLAFCHSSYWVTLQGHWHLFGWIEGGIGGAMWHKGRLLTVWKALEYQALLWRRWVKLWLTIVW